MIVEHLVLGPLGCNATIIGDEVTREAIVVDGGDGVERVTSRLAELDLRAKFLVHTHAHLDHIGDVGTLRERTGAQALLHPLDLPIYAQQPALAALFGVPTFPVVALDGDLHDDDTIAAGSLRLSVLHTPGHTPGSVCFTFSDGDETKILSGDTLFRGSIGRWDLGGTSMEDIVSSIHAKLMDFNDASVVVPGHGPITTIGIERRTNPYLQP